MNHNDRFDRLSTGGRTFNWQVPVNEEPGKIKTFSHDNEMGIKSVGTTRARDDEQSYAIRHFTCNQQLKDSKVAAKLLLHTVLSRPWLASWELVNKNLSAT